MSHNKLNSRCDITGRKFDGICVTSSNSHYNGPHYPFVACERLKKCKNRHSLSGNCGKEGTKSENRQASVEEV